jgi:ribosomal protein S18 acetylase RimI-like enzyme
VAYGEVWHDGVAGEAELARILVAPEERGRGVGRALTRLLAAEARAAGFDEVWLRVVPDNEQAIAAYRAAGFVRTSEEEERVFNEDQRLAYVWMRLELPLASA